jgi:hypothetical protein
VRRLVGLTKLVLAEMNGHVDGRAALALGVMPLDLSQPDLPHLAALLDGGGEFWFSLLPSGERGGVNPHHSGDFFFEAANLREPEHQIDVDLGARPTVDGQQ